MILLVSWLISISPPDPPPKKAGMGVFKAMFRKKSSESSSYSEKDYSEPELVEEMFEDGSAVLAQRLDTEYPTCNMFKLFLCAICQFEIKPGEGILVHAGSSQPGRLRPWDGPLLCPGCQAKKEAMEGKTHSRGIKIVTPYSGTSKILDAVDC